MEEGEVGGRLSLCMAEIGQFLCDFTAAMAGAAAGGASLVEAALLALPAADAALLLGSMRHALAESQPSSMAEY